MTISLHLGDCLEILPTLEADSVDAVITSPPYDNLRDYNGYNFEFKPTAKQLYGVISNGGVIVWVVADQTIDGSETGTSFTQALHFKSIGFNLHDTMIYEKAGLSYPDKNRYYSMFEYMFILSKGKPKTFNQIKDRVNITAGANVHGRERRKDGSTNPNRACLGNIIDKMGARWNIWRIPNPGKAGTVHPATFPIQLAYDHAISWTNPGDTILDPFMGSGTTGVACVQTGRNFIGIEIEPKYYEIAEKRIAEAQLQIRMEL